MATRLWLAALFALLSVGLVTQPASAHPMQIVPIVVVLRPQATFLTVEFKGAASDLDTATGLDDSAVKGDGFTDAATKILNTYFQTHLVLKQGKELHGAINDADFDADNYDPTKSKFEIYFRYPRNPKDAKKPFYILTHLFENVQNAPTIISAAGFEKQLQPGEDMTLDPSAVTTNLLNNIHDFMMLGMMHIFTGPDHMMFILSLLLVSTSFWSLAKTLTGFTISHSITLALSALSVIVIDNRIVDIFIAISIIYVGLENIYSKNTKHRFWIAAAFGLVHGFGFSGALREIGLPEQGLLWCLMSFNVGVEIAQVILCAIAFPILMHVKKKFEFEEQYGGMGWTKAMHCASWFVVVMGASWLMLRALPS